MKKLERLYPIAFYIAAIGFLINLVLYALTFFDVNPPEWPLLFLVIVVLLAAIAKLNTNEKLKALKKAGGIKPLDTLKVMFEHSPLWLKILAGICVVFASLNHLLLMHFSPGHTGISNGAYVLYDRGEILRVLTEREYQHELAIEARMSLGLSLSGFGVVSAILWPWKKEERSV